MKTCLSMLVIAVFAAAAANAQSTADLDYLEELQANARQQQLWLERSWLNLLHYRAHNSGLFNSGGMGYSSSVDDDAFFIAPTGVDHPDLELAATLGGFFSESDLGDEHPQCRFPARLDWLAERLEIDRSRLPSVDCALYQQWRNIIHPGSVVLLFPAHHLNSPSSMFGHTLLRIDPKKANRQTDWLSFAVNFGANVPTDQNSLLYAYRGVTGGYPGEFVVGPYFIKIQEYNRVENRDIWEYPLNLTQRETDRLVTHLWELNDINFDYYFFKENCSYRLLELLEIARPSVELTDDFAITAIPMDTVRSVERAGLITNTLYRPSLASQLRFKLTVLPSSLYPLIAELTENSAVTDTSAFQDLSDREQYAVLQAAYQALRYQEAKKVRDDATAKNSLSLLAKINRYPVQPAAEIPMPVPPEKGHQSRRVAVTAGRDGDKNFAELSLRLGYHSLLDNSYGFLKGGQINMGDVAFRYYDDGNVKLERLDIADVFSLAPNDLFFDSVSWRIYGGLERVNVDDERPLAAHVTGGVGYGVDLRGTTLYGLFSARLEHNRDFDTPAEVAGGAQFGWLYQSRLGMGSVTVSGLKFSGGEHRLEMGLGQDFVLAVNSSIRLSANRRWYDSYTGTELSLGYHYFFR